MPSKSSLNHNHSTEETQKLEEGDGSVILRAPKRGRWSRLQWGLAWFLLVVLICTAIGMLIYLFTPRSRPTRPLDSLTSNHLLLPKTLWPREYFLTIKPYLELEGRNGVPNLTFTGAVRIVIDCVNRTDFIRIHSLDLNFTADHVSLKHIESADGLPLTPELKVDSVVFDNKTQMVTLHVDQMLKDRSAYILQIDHFVGTVRYDGRGLYLSSYWTSLQQHRLLVATQFEVADARRMFPCFDEPRFKANFTMSIVRRQNFRSLSNMQIENSYPTNNGWVTDTYYPSVKMSTYLVALVVCDFKYKSRMSRSNVEVRAFSRPEAVKEVDHALDMAIRILDYFAEYFGIPYALNKLDLIALPDFSHGAMENWGLVTFKEKTMLYNSERDNRKKKEVVSMIVGHEVAHQWFGNLVTMEWWNDLWLNEGFANYMGYVVAEIVDAEEKMEDVFILNNVLPALELDSMSTTHPVLTEVYHPDDIVQLFDTITYKKGSCLIRMMIHLLGHKTMRRGLQIYLRDHSYANTESDDLWFALDQAVALSEYSRKRMDDISLATVMHNWVMLTGYPVVSLTRAYDSSYTANITQARFTTAGHGSHNDSDSIWDIPFTYTDQRRVEWIDPPLIWLKNRTKIMNNMPSDDQWIVGNINMEGFYRVNYDMHNWNLLVDQLRSDHSVFTVFQRAQILEDSFEFSSTDLVDIRLFLNATAYLDSETEYLPWHISLANFKYIDNMIQGDEEYPAFQEFLQNQLRPSYEKAGWHKGIMEEKLVTYKRHLVVQQACHYQLPECIANATYHFNNWMVDQNTINNVPIMLRLIVQCYGIMHGGEEQWDYVWRAFRSSRSNAEKLDLLQSLTCTNDPKLQQKLLEASLNSTLVRTWHLPDLMRDMSRSLTGRRASWKFIREHWQEYLDNLHEVAAELSTALSYFNSDAELKQLEVFMKSHALGPTKRKFLESKENILINRDWKKRNRAKVLEWVKEHMNGVHESQKSLRNTS